MTTFGVEEEFMFLDPETLRPVDVGTHVHESMAAEAEWSPIVNHEYLASQVEHTSAVFTTLTEASAALDRFRREVAERAGNLDVIAASVGMPFQAPVYPTITEDDRYERVVSDYRQIIADHQINGLHMHVGIADRDAGVRALNRVRLWMPLLQAMCGNSPFWRGVDTGFESWRGIVVRRWAVSGCPPVFVDAADYERRLRNVVGVGGTFDTGMVMWNVRLSEHVPTLEVRVCDAQLTTDDTLLLVALVRGLVTTAIAEAADATPNVAPELLDNALWQSARDGLRGRQLDPISGSMTEARTALDVLQAYIADQLEAEGDREFVTAGIARLLHDGTGAHRQRAAMHAGGLPGLARLLRESVTAPV
ncbi:YbdK family carboxylate-amine ligase [Leifsonia sp. YIM 134122]|uniref:Putative glutamate--cysteine ligase 2 n=1 Tax=Leifsonia stereocauli TaxID=3134136 RepID=A0ABU9W8G7_9MICO